ncbi:alpha/beta hydrolase family protein [Streptosporangium carneum]|uniref:Lipase n=1 Tax=Streptosporangium carneum TaxID=47481 RepID=A0A9W6I6P7_9ACTN|nr:alpha/beta hydrolase [Streptosporangium carneum]GLK12697.1 lipase [Streptosporangium carneum]
MEDRSVLTRPAPGPDRTLRYGEDADQVADLWHSEGPTVALIHGGFWRPEYDRAHLRPMANALRGAGWNVASIEYRREPGRPGPTLDDVRSALGEIGPSVVVGHSAGGHLALCAAPDDVAVLALAPVADLRLAHRLDLDDGAVADFLGGPPDDRAALDPVRLPGRPGRVTIVHGAGDERVPLDVSESYVSAHPATSLARIPDAGHFVLIDPESEAWPIVLRELTALVS